MGKPKDKKDQSQLEMPFYTKFLFPGIAGYVILLNIVWSTLLITKK